MAREPKCYACGKPIKHAGYPVDTLDEQVVDVGPECFRKIKAAGAAGYQPPLGGPRLFNERPAKPARAS